MTSLEYVRPKTELKLVFLLEQNITQQHWDRLDRLRLAGIGVDKGGINRAKHERANDTPYTYVHMIAG